MKSQVETNTITFHSPPEYVNKDLKSPDCFDGLDEKENKENKCYKKLSKKVFILTYL